MTHPLHDYLCQQLDEQLRKNGIVVFYDPRREFEPFFEDELKDEDAGNGALPRVRMKERLTYVARYRGSFFALRHEVEHIAQVDSPEPLILYLPGVERNRKGSILMELEKGGRTYEPQLKRLAANVLRRHFTQGRVDKMLAPTKVSYTDIAAFLQQGGDGLTTSVLHTFFGEAKSEALIARWLADENTDAGIGEKEAKEELFNLIESRLGLAVPTEDAFATARAKVIRHVLVNEFRSDLDCEAPKSTAMVPSTSTQEHRNRAREVAETLRSNHGSSYVALADRVEGELGLVAADIDASFLGKIDTFRFEERALLAHAGELISSRKYVDALNVVNERSRSFWVDREVNRQAQWEAYRLMAELGEAVKQVRPLLGKNNGSPVRWIQAYASEQGWFRVDSLQRNLETWVSKMDQEPETERPLALVRREHEELLKKMAEGFTEVFLDAGWSVPDILHQTQIYPDVVKTMGGRTAYFLVDAMRFEMGVELAQQLDGAEDLTVRPAIAALPTITPVGMAALMPGASAGFSLVESKDNLAADVAGSLMVTSAQRMKVLKAKVPGAVEMLLGKLLGEAASSLKKSVNRASLVVVRSQEIDSLGENVDELTARAAMEGVIGNVARAIRKLATGGSAELRSDRRPRAPVFDAQGRGHENGQPRREYAGDPSPMLDRPRRGYPCRVCAGQRSRARVRREPRVCLPKGPRRVQGRRRSHLSPRRNQPSGARDPCGESPHTLSGSRGRGRERYRAPRRPGQGHEPDLCRGRAGKWRSLRRGTARASRRPGIGRPTGRPRWNGHRRRTGSVEPPPPYEPKHRSERWHGAHKR